MFDASPRSARLSLRPVRSGTSRKAPNTSSGSSPVVKKAPRRQFNGASCHGSFCSVQRSYFPLLFAADFCQNAPCLQAKAWRYGAGDATCEGYGARSVELATVARRDWQHLKCAPGLHKIQHPASPRPGSPAGSRSWAHGSKSSTWNATCAGASALVVIRVIGD